MEETTGLANFIAYAKKLTNIQRWNTEFLYHKASVAEHSYSVAQIAQCIGIIEQKHGKKIDWAKLYRKAIKELEYDLLMFDHSFVQFDYIDTKQGFILQEIR